MKYRRVPGFLNTSLVFFCLALLSFISDGNLSARKRVRIEDQSRLYLQGTSNVNAFTCDCEDRFEAQLIETESGNGYSRFRNAGLALRVKSLNCKNRKIDTDLQKALMADQYPNIQVTLLDTWQSSRCADGSCYDWFDVQANVIITIAQVNSKEFIRARARKLGPNKFQLKGEKWLKMSAFGITPPEAMFGMIKVNDDISFHFDLVVTVDEHL
ncbi:MAG: hypothetical protein RL013_2374 [Bacteroidota bacterium]|jgi:hypothetical protein